MKTCSKRTTSTTRNLISTSKESSTSLRSRITHKVRVTVLKKTPSWTITTENWESTQRRWNQRLVTKSSIRRRPSRRRSKSVSKLRTANDVQRVQCSTKWWRLLESTQTRRHLDVWSKLSSRSSETTSSQSQSPMTRKARMPRWKTGLRNPKRKSFRRCSTKKSTDHCSPSSRLSCRPWRCRFARSKSSLASTKSKNSAPITRRRKELLMWKPSIARCNRRTKCWLSPTQPTSIACWTRRSSTPIKTWTFWSNSSQMDLMSSDAVFLSKSIRRSWHLTL